MESDAATEISTKYVSTRRKQELALCRSRLVFIIRCVLIPAPTKERKWQTGMHYANPESHLSSRAKMNFTAFCWL